MTAIPADLQYTSDHEWVATGDIATVGITRHAVDALGDVVYVELPAVGDMVTAGEPCGEIESTKSVSDLFAPVSGEIVEVNDDVVDATELIGEDPYGKGWLFKIRMGGDAPDLLSADAYAELIADE